MKRIDNEYSRANHIHELLGLFVAFVLVFSIISTVDAIGSQTALAEKGGKRAEKGETSKDQGTNQTRSTTKQSDGDYGKKAKDNEKTEDKSVKRAWQQQLNQTADEIHKKHLKMNARFSGAYTSNMTYTLSANGTAEALGNSTNEAEAQVSVEMSVWKSTPGQVKMDVTGGTVTVDGESTEVHSGHAHYWLKNNRMLVIAFVVVGGEDGDNAEETTNQTSTANQTSTDSTIPAEEDAPETTVRVLKLWITIPEGSGPLPTGELAEPVEVTIKSRQSKLASMWFLDMSGEVTLST